MSPARHILLAVAVAAAGAATAVAVGRDEPAGAGSRLVTVSVPTTVVRTVTQATGPSSSPEPDPDDAARTSPAAPVVEKGYKLVSTRYLRLNNNGYDLGGADGPMAADNGDVRVFNGKISIDSSITVAKWPPGQPSASGCETRATTQSFSQNEAYGIPLEAGLALCFTMQNDNGNLRVGYMRIRSDYTDNVAQAYTMLWDRVG